MQTQLSTYIGLDSDDSGQALQLASILGPYATLHWCEQTDIRISRDHHKLPRSGFLNSTAEGWKALRTLFQRPWSSRVWIAQEIALSQDQVMVCGKHLFSWTPLYRIVLFCRSGKLPIIALDKIDDRYDPEAGVSPQRIQQGAAIINFELMAFLQLEDSSGLRCFDCRTLHSNC